MTGEQFLNLDMVQRDKYMQWQNKLIKSAKKIESNEERIYHIISKYAKKFRRKGICYLEIVDILDKSECYNCKEIMRGETNKSNHRKYYAEFNCGLDNIYLA